MSCAAVQSWLLEHRIEDFDAVADHLACCGGCRGLADRIREQAAALDAELDDFAHASDFAAVWGDTVGAAAPPRRNPMVGWLWMAAAATLALASSPQWADAPRWEAAVPIDAGVSACWPLTPLEAHALLGRLSDPQVTCLVDRIEDDALDPSDRIAASRVLMAHRWAASLDHAGWEDAARYHLDVLEDPDPDLAYKVAVYLSNQSPLPSDEVIRYADLALQRRTVWTGDTYVGRVNSLYKLRAHAGLAVVQGSPAGERSEAALDEAIGLVREWLDYVRVAGLDDAVPLRLCAELTGAVCD